jgi:hypothetical protein
VGDWTLEEATRFEYTPLLANPFTGITVTAGGTTLVMGSYATLGYAPFDCAGIQFGVQGFSSATGYMADVAFGPAGSEQVVIENLYLTAPGGSSRCRNYFFPLAVPVGTRVSMRILNTTINSTLKVVTGWFQQSAMGSPTVSRIITYGAIRSTALGTALTDPAAGAWGGWVILTPVGGTIANHNWILPMFGDKNIATRTSGNFFASQIAVGAAASERVLTPPYYFGASSTVLSYNMHKDYWMSIPQGSVLSMRYAVVTATALGVDGVIYAGVA